MTRTYTPTPGQHIEAACADMVALALKHGEAVQATFNGVTLYAVATDTPSEVAGRYQEACRRAAERYENSAEGKADKERVRQEGVQRTRQTQESFHAMIAAAHAKDDKALMTAVATFTEAADFVGVRFDMQEAAKSLRAAGFVAGEGVGDPDVASKADKHKLARYIVGQAITFMDDGMPPHPVCASFAKNWLRECA